MFEWNPRILDTSGVRHFAVLPPRYFPVSLVIEYSLNPDCSGGLSLFLRHLEVKKIQNVQSPASILTPQSKQTAGRSFL